MAQVINDSTPGGRIGASFGNVLGQGLQQLAQHKMTQLQQRNQAKAFGSLGLPEGLAQGLAMLSPQQQSVILKSIGENQGFGNQQQMFSQQMAQPQTQQQSPMQTMQQPMAQQKPAANIEDSMRALNMMPQNPLDALSRQIIGSQAPSIEQRGMAALKQPAKTPEQKMGQQVLAQAKQPAGSAAFVDQTRDKILSTQPVNKFQQSLYKEAKKQEIKQKHAEMKEASKENREYIKDQYDAGREAHENDLRLGRLEKLARSEKLSRPRFAGLLDTVAHGVFGHGINLKSLLSPETEEFDKVSKEMIKGAKSIFGSRITDQDLKTFLNMIPNISQSREGKLRVIHQMKLFNEGVHVRKQAMNDIIRDNNGIAPKDLKNLVEDRIQPRLNDIAQRYVQGLEEPREEQGFFERPKSFLPGNPLDMLLGKG